MPSEPTRDVRVVLCTCPPAAVADLCRALLDEGLVACVNVVPGVRSLYRWKGEIVDDAESLLVLKTTPARFDALHARLTALHPYEVPEVLGLDTASGAEAYVSWVYDSVAS